jgi:hypothetical protein
MSTARRIDRVRLKIERAKKHVRDADIAIRAFLDDKPYTIGVKPHRVPEIRHTTLYVASVKAVPDEITLMVGDAIHNLRSALDHVMWQLVEAAAGKPNRDTYFPIIVDGPKAAQQFASAIGRGEIQKIAPEALKIIEEAQPYKTLDQNLWLLHQLDIVDKHRLLLTVAAHMDKWGVDVAAGTTIWFDEYRFIPLVEGYEITSIPTATYERQSHEDFQLGAEVAFGESELPEGELVLPTLNKFAELIDGIVSRFDPFLG